MRRKTQANKVSPELRARMAFRERRRLAALTPAQAAAEQAAIDRKANIDDYEALRIYGALRAGKITPLQAAAKITKL